MFQINLCMYGVHLEVKKMRGSLERDNLIFPRKRLRYWLEMSLTTGTKGRLENTPIVFINLCFTQRICQSFKLGKNLKESCRRISGICVSELSWSEYGKRWKLSVRISDLRTERTVMA